ncbi:MAG: hypothetical protein JKY48_06215, partial [Flavobacteriales bacterium]|nr:hypothetical protein [Flavobacteriales bacterium]
MKKLLLSFTILLTSFSSYSSDFAGGSITWECLPTGKYIFYMEAFQTCSGPAWTYQTEVIDVVASSMPTNGVIAIVVLPDSNRWNNSGTGDLSQQCSPLLGTAYSCANGDDGAVQAYYYISAPIALMGVPPQDGWKFYWEGGARDTSIKNVNVVGTGLLRSIMYP